MAGRQGANTMNARIRYREGYKYQLVEDYFHQTPITGYSVQDEYIQLTPAGMLSIAAGYAWDGPSGPTIDTKNFLRGSLVHDALYQLIRDHKIDESNRLVADQILYDTCRADGMNILRAYMVKKAVNWFGGSAAAGNPYPILEAP